MFEWFSKDSDDAVSMLKRDHDTVKDLNRNLTKDTGEPGLANARVTMGYFSTVTANNGYFMFRAPAGNVREMIPRLRELRRHRHGRIAVVFFAVSDDESLLPHRRDVDTLGFRLRHCIY